MNPIIEPSPLKYGAVQFNKIKPEHFMPALKHAIDHGRQAIAKIKASPPSFENSIAALDQCTEEMEHVNLLFTNLLLAHANEDLQKLSMEIGPQVASFANDILLDPDVFARIKSVYEQRDTLKLTPEQKYLTEKVYRDFRRSGAELSPDKKDRLRAIDERLSQLGPKFRENVLASTNAFELWISDEKDLIGLPDSAKQAAKQEAIEKNQPDKWLITLQHPSVAPFLRFSQKRELREKVYRAYNQRAFSGAHNNQPIILESVRLMNEKAQLLGAKSYTQWALETRMAETPEQVNEFLASLLKVAKPAAQKDIQEIEALAKETDGLARLEPWDFQYYSERLKEKKYAFDEESMRVYFKLENVLNGVFELGRRLFGLKFVENKELPVYHEDVKVYEVLRENGDFVGLFYTDFFPRASKSGGAWMTNFFEQGLFRGDNKRPHVSNVCNFTKPTPDKPSLLTFDEVRTLFHEFGHALHSLMSRVQYRSLAGTNVYLDFVELPSQVLENWAEEEELLKHFATHYKTGELIPNEMLARLKESQLFQAGYLAMRQLNFAYLDLAWFSGSVPENTNVLEFEKQATAHTSVLPRVEGTNISTSFGHIFGGGYSSGYYSYKWAEALDADAFEFFKENGIFDRETAKRFEEHILSKGGSDHPMRLYEKFRGRKPDPSALLRRDGLI